jgi:hypothetical protein
VLWDEHLGLWHAKKPRLMAELSDLNQLEFLVQFIDQEKWLGDAFDVLRGRAFDQSMLEMHIDRLQQQELLPIQLYSVLVGSINDQTVIVVFL